MEGRNVKLSKRLEAVAMFVKQGSYVADIGTDHAYLAAYLAINGISEHIIASDIAVSPLKAAEKTIMKYGLEDKVEILLSNGLEEISPVAVDTIIIAGMGGNTIAEILDRVSWTKAQDIHLILQPMTGAKDLRCFLYENGYSIKKECPVVDAGQVYSVMSVNYDVFRDHITDVYSYIGKVPFFESPEREIYLKKVVSTLEKKRNGIALSNFGAEERDRQLRELKRTITSIKQILKGIETNVYS